MTELKTLKDITNKRFLCAKCFMEVEPPADGILFNQVNAIILKKEAIKWIKECKKEIKKRGLRLDYTGKQMGIYFEGQKDFIIEFFNLTEEDLK